MNPTEQLRALSAAMREQYHQQSASVPREQAWAETMFWWKKKYQDLMFGQMAL